VQSEEERLKAERQAKIQAWKQKQLEAKQRKEKETAAAKDGSASTEPGPAASAALAPPSSPTATLGIDAVPKAYAGKFDPKAIIKKATATTVTTVTLGTDVPLPGQAKASATLKPPASGLKADTSSSAGIKSSTGKRSRQLRRSDTPAK
jgi:ATP-dependent RNA helicase DDX46/PRP5